LAVRLTLLGYYGQEIPALTLDVILDGEDVLALNRSLLEVGAVTLRRVYGDGVRFGAGLRGYYPEVVAACYLRVGDNL
jgi:hypothetical protein